jgi:hypothetical protein
MRRRAFVRLRRLGIPAKHGQQRCERQDKDDSAANAIDLRWHDLRWHDFILTYQAVAMPPPGRAQ